MATWHPLPAWASDLIESRPVIGADRAGRLMVFSPPLEERLGFRLEDMRSSAPPWPFWPPEEASGLEKVFALTVARADAGIGLGAVRIRLRTSDEHRVNFLAVYHPVFDVDGAPVVHLGDLVELPRERVDSLAELDPLTRLRLADAFANSTTRLQLAEAYAETSAEAAAELERRPGETLAQALDRLGRRMIEHEIEEFDGDRAAAAAVLGMSARELEDRLGRA